MSKSAGQPGYRVRYRPGEVRTGRRGRRLRGFQDVFVGITRAAYWLGLLGLLVYAGYQSYVLFQDTSYFRIQEVVITGNQVLQKQDILALSKIEYGSHFLRYKTDAIRQALVAHPRIRDASVEQASPQKIAIQVVENRPLLRTIADGSLQEVGEDGRFLGVADASLATTLPLLLGLPEAKRDASGMHRVAPELFAQLPSWLGVLRESFLSTFDSVDFRSPFRVEVHWKGMRFYVAEPQDLRDMAPHVQATLSDAEKRRVRVATMDLRFHMLVVHYGSAPATEVSTWTVALAPARAAPTTTAATAPLEPALTSHPSVVAAATTTSTSADDLASESARFSEAELRALDATAVETQAERVEASKPAFEAEPASETDDEDAPDPAYIYNPPGFPGDSEAPDDDSREAASNLAGLQTDGEGTEDGN